MAFSASLTAIAVARFSDMLAPALPIL